MNMSLFEELARPLEPRLNDLSDAIRQLNRALQKGFPAFVEYVGGGVKFAQIVAGLA